MARISSTFSLHASAANCLSQLLHVQLLVRSGQASPPPGMLPSVLAATELAHLLINGSRCSSTGSCSCSLVGSSGARRAVGAPKAPVLAFRNAATSLSGSVSLPAGQVTALVLGRLSVLHQEVCTGDEDRRALAGKGALLLQLQLAALYLLQARAPRGGQPRQGGQASNSRASSIPSCGDTSAFLGTADASAFSAIEAKQPAGVLLSQARLVVSLLAAALEAEGAPPACRHCTPEQLLVAVEAATAYPDPTQGGSDPSPPDALGCMLVLLDEHGAAWRAWLPDFMRRAVPTLSAFARAAAQQLPAAGGSMYMSTTLLQAVTLLSLPPGGVLHSPRLHSRAGAARPEQLLAWAEQALRSQPPGVHMPGAAMGAEILTVGVGPAARAGAHAPNAASADPSAPSKRTLLLASPALLILSRHPACPAPSMPLLCSAGSPTALPASTSSGAAARCPAWC
jgi:hypothetical protein